MNYPFTDISRRPFPDWGAIYMNAMGGRSNYHGLQTAFTKRLSQRWQASGTYTLGWQYDDDGRGRQSVHLAGYPRERAVDPGGNPE